jgi:hypothetical protein
MHYDITVFLEKTGEFDWHLKTDSNVVLLEFKSPSLLDASLTAKKYMSSWTSVNLVVNNEKDK